MTTWPPGVRAVAGLLLGAVVAVLVLLTHRDAIDVAGARVPFGLVLAVLGSALPSMALRHLGGEWAVGAYGAGWILVVLLMVGGRPEGDYLIASDWIGWTFLVLSSLVVVVVTVRGMLADRRPRPVGGDPDDLAVRRP